MKLQVEQRKDNNGKLEDMRKGKLYDDIMYGGHHKEEPKGEL